MRSIDGILDRLAGCRRGTLSTSFGVAAPLLLALVAGGVDYAALTRQKSDLQQVVDAAALAVAREMTIRAMSAEVAGAAAGSFAAANAGRLAAQGLATRTRISPDGLAVTVSGQVNPATTFRVFNAIADGPLAAEATARLGGSQNKLCLLSLAEARTTYGLYRSTETTGIDLQGGARLTADGCTLHTNVAGTQAARIAGGATARAGLLCSAGGLVNQGGTLQAETLTGCPKLANPLEARAFPKHGLCLFYKNRVYNAGTVTLNPGEYCGNIIIEGSAKVKMNPGKYAIQGQLIVRGNAELTGSGVGIYLWGEVGNAIPSYFYFLENALIDLSAPESGDMAGVLIWESSNGAQLDKVSGTAMNLFGAPTKPKTQSGGTPTAPVFNYNYHQINSLRAQRLNGTIYLPAGRLLIDAPAPVAAASDYTVLVVNRLDLSDGPNLVLNSDYAKSPVPVPQGLGPIGAKQVRLVSQ